MKLQPLDLATAGKILDFTGGDPDLASLGKLQLEGTVAVHNMIADPEVGMAYLADEVGMGKTYIALGAVALMRYFNPSLRVLFICPSANVQDKWYTREYRSFTKHNVKVEQYRVRTIDGKPGTPRVNCLNVPDLIQSASMGYYADFFVGMGSFSMALNEDNEQWRKRLEELHAMLPAYALKGLPNSKKSVKDRFADALNYVLPTFDLVVIDEAHKFKHDFDSSDRNRVLSAVLGFRDTGKNVPRVKNALLLSATPYDRNLDHLRNQLKLVGKGHLLPHSVGDEEKASINTHLSKFLVRRLNELNIAGIPHTRNMYRREWRSGNRAEITLATDEQKLVTALVQKKVGEMLDQKGATPSFQTGLLASFESYAESTRSKPVEFDGDASEKETTDARDRHVIGRIVDSYIETGLGTTLPHPKMDTVTIQLAKSVFEEGRKQIAFVRRVKSVKELKNKLDDRYNTWIIAYLRAGLTELPEQEKFMESVISAYQIESRRKEDDISGGEYRVTESGEAEDLQPPKNDTIFAWFFRGLPPAPISSLLDAMVNPFTTPEAMRRALGARNQVISTLFEINWAAALCRVTGDDLAYICDKHGQDIANLAGKYTRGRTQNDQLELFQASQLGFIEWYSRQNNIPGLMKILNHLQPTSQREADVEVTTQRLCDSLLSNTLFDAIEFAGLAQELFPLLPLVLTSALENTALKSDLLLRLDIHAAVLSLCLRTGHGVIDLYLSRLRLGTENLTAGTRSIWMESFVGQLKEQAQYPGFSTYWELRNLAEQLDLVIKTNLAEIFDKEPEEYRKYLSQMLNPVAPVIGATGETYSSRSAQARKFRMPGYPLVLISTDVFQEGEDLHTFCDRVMHYGLSGSPVGIEQKTGRIDRVGSQAQRRLLKIQDKSAINDDQLIQVTFPFVKESIEVLQVRQLCQNINEFIKSLHEVGSQRIDANDIINFQAAMLDRSGIPEQIRTPLKSPYIPHVENENSRDNREQFVADQEAHTKRVTSHISALLKQYFGKPVLGEEGLMLKFRDGTERPIKIGLRSARACGELLLRADMQDTGIIMTGLNRVRLIKMMREHSWHTLHRTYARETAKGIYQLHHDAEFLIGDENVTTASEISHFFERFMYGHNPCEYKKPAALNIVQYWSQAKEGNAAQFGQLKATVGGFERKDRLALTFTFGEKSWRRKHDVSIYEADGHCIFLAQAADADGVAKLSIDQLIRYTWQRNAHIDIVNFMLSDAGALVGRAVHPIDGLNFKEFAYCAYTLAVSTDRLEYLIQQPDLY